MRLLPRDAAWYSADAVELGDVDLASLGEAEMRRIRGKSISMVFQEPATALDPVFTIGGQVSAVFRRHRGQARREARASSRGRCGRRALCRQPGPGGRAGALSDGRACMMVLLMCSCPCLFV